MTKEDFEKLLGFLGSDEYCYVMLRKDNIQSFKDMLKSTSVDYSLSIMGDSCSTIGFYPSLMNNNRRNGNALLLKKEYVESVRYDAEIMKLMYIFKKEYVLNKLEEKKEKESNPKDNRKNKPNNAKSDKGRTNIPPIPKYNDSLSKKGNYNIFLKSKYWSYVRNIKLSESGYKCQICGSSYRLNVHHNTYAHHYEEHNHLEDLVVLCDHCHELFHKSKRI